MARMRREHWNVLSGKGSIAIEDLSWVHSIVGVKCALEGAHDVERIAVLGQ
jgi:hypothetical protein